MFVFFNQRKILFSIKLSKLIFQELNFQELNFQNDREQQYFEPFFIHYFVFKVFWKKVELNNE